MLIVFAASFFVEIVMRGRSLRVFTGVEISEPRKPLPYRDIPFAAQPRTIKFLESDADISAGQPIRIVIRATSRTYFGRLRSVPGPFVKR